MGEVSYKLMAILIAKQIDRAIRESIARYQGLARELDISDVHHTENLLSLSIRLAEETRRISLDILEKNERIVKLDKSLQEYKNNLLKIESKGSLK